MKKILLLALCFSFYLGISAQSFSLSYSGGPIAPGGTIQVLGNPTDMVIQAYISVTNNASVAKSVKAKKMINDGDTLAGTDNYFCWDICYTEFTYVSFGALSIEPGQTNNNFYGDYNPLNVPGISKVKYVFFDAESRNDSVAVTVEFNASPASVGDDLISAVKFANAYPNPARNSVSVDYSIPFPVNNVSVVVSNMLGSKVKEISLGDRNGKARIDVTGLMDGIYFYSLVVDNSMLLTRKFVVRH
jgi:hypothetical protein